MSHLRPGWIPLAHIFRDEMPFSSVRRSDLNAAWTGWQAALDKAGFISLLSASLAAALTRVFYTRCRRDYRRAWRERKEHHSRPGDGSLYQRQIAGLNALQIISLQSRVQLDVVTVMETLITIGDAFDQAEPKQQRILVRRTFERFWLSQMQVEAIS